MLTSSGKGASSACTDCSRTPCPPCGTGGIGTCGCNRTSGGRPSQIHQLTFHGPQIRRGMAGYLLPEEVESIRSDRAFQDGHPPRSPGLVGEEHVSVQTRLEKCISLNSGGPQGPPVPVFSAPSDRHTVAVHMPTVRVIGCTSCIHEGSSPSCFSPLADGVSLNDLPRRLAARRPITTQPPRFGASCRSVAGESGFHREQIEICADTHNDGDLLRYGLRHNSHGGPVARNQGEEGPARMPKGSESGFHRRVRVKMFAWQDGSIQVCCKGSSAPSLGTAVPATGLLAGGLHAHQPSACSSVPMGQCRSTMVVIDGSVDVHQPYSRASHHTDHRGGCIAVGLGCSVRPTQVRRPMASTRVYPSHQLAGDEGCAVGPGGSVVTYAYNIHAVLRTHSTDCTVSYSSRTHLIYDTYAFIILCL